MGGGGGGGDDDDAMAFPHQVARCLTTPFARATCILCMMENRTRTNKRGTQSATRCLRFLMRSIRAVYVEAREAVNVEADVEDGVLDAEAAEAEAEFEAAQARAREQLADGDGEDHGADRAGNGNSVGGGGVVPATTTMAAAVAATAA